MKKIIIVAILSMMSIFSHANIDDQNEIMDLERQARKGDAQVQYKLGLMNEFGVKVREDMDEAIKWYDKADKQGVVRATTRLGVIYYEQEIYSKSIPYLKKAMDENEPLSIVYYGKNQLRINKISDAEFYFKKAMELDNPQSFYEYGIVEGDYKNNKYLGYVNTKLAELKGYKKARAKSNEYKKSLSPNQLYSANDRIKRMIDK